MPFTTPAFIHTARPDGYIDYFNRGWLDFFGKSLEDVCGWRWTETVHPDDVAAIVQKWHAALASGEPFEIETRVRRAAPTFAAIAIDAENIDDHRQREFAVDSGVSLGLTNERTQRFLQEHLNAMREVVPAENSACPSRRCLSVSTDRRFTGEKRDFSTIRAASTTDLIGRS